MACRVVNIRDAHVRTVSVDIRILAISGKQVTLAVFRQLLQERLLSKDGTLNGVPWGLVNYHPDGCKDDAPHWHVVWQRGDELRRDIVYTNPVFGSFSPPSADPYVVAYVRDIATGRCKDQMPEAWRHTNRAMISYGDMVVTGVLSEAGVDLIRKHRYGIKESVDKAVDAIGPADTDLLWRILVQDCEREKTRRARWIEATKGIGALPQLFIAV